MTRFCAAAAPVVFDGEKHVNEIRRWLTSIGGPRCREPAAYETPLGERCEGCIEKYREAMRSPNNMMNIMLGRPRTEEEIEQSIRRITETDADQK